MARIDLFSHFCTQEFRAAYFAIPPGSEGRRPDPRAVHAFYQGQRTTNIDVLWDVDQRIKAMDRYGIDLQVLTMCHPMVDGLAPEPELQLARLLNDGLAEMIQKYPDRLLGVATLPFSSPDKALEEFDRCVDRLGFKGFQIGSNVNGLPLDSPQFFPLYARAASRGLPVWIHPTTPVTLDILGTKANVDLLFGWPLDTSIALLKLVIGGVLERFPDLKIIVHHLGAGMVPYFLERFDGMAGAPQGDWGLARPPSYYWKRMYHDTASVDANAFACGYQVFGPEHTVFATDYPYGREKGEYHLRSRREIIDNAALDDSARRKIYEDNARKLLNL